MPTTGIPAEALDEARRFPEHTQALGLIRTHSRLDAAALAVAPTQPDPALFRRLDRHLEDRDPLLVEAAGRAGRSLDEIQQERLSERYFAPRPVPVEVVAAVVEEAARFDRAAWPDDRAGAGLQFLVAARDVTGLPEALYLADPAAHGFTRISDLPTGPAAADLVLQVEFADAPVTLMVCGPLAASLDRHGEHGHRLLLTRAGAAAHAAWLGAMDHGLVGSVFAGFLSAGLRPLAPVDGYHNAQLLAFAFGYKPAQAARPDVPAA